MYDNARALRITSAISAVASVVTMSTRAKRPTIHAVPRINKPGIATRHSNGCGSLADGNCSTRTAAAKHKEHCDHCQSRNIVGAHALYWGMPDRTSKKLPRDINQLAAADVPVATSEEPDGITMPKEPKKNAAAVELGRLGGLKGGKARALKLNAAQRKEIAAKAARARWNRSEKES